MNIGYVFDDNFACCATISIVSVMANHTNIPNIDFFIFDDGISQNNKDNLRRLVEKYNRNIVFYDIKPIINYLESLNVNPWRGRYSAYIKLLISKLIPTNISRLIILDADTVVDGSIYELHTMNLDNHPCAMSFEGIHADYRTYSGIGTGPLYNTGVIVYDLQTWNEKKIEEKLLFHLKNVNSRYLLPEEDPISIILKNDVKILSPKYNFITQFTLYNTTKYFKRFKWNNMKENFYSLEEVREAGKDVRVFHCIDTFTNRPWHQNNIHPYTSIFDKYYNETFWRNIPKKKKEMTFISQIEYLLRKFLPYKLSIYLYYISARIVYTFNAKRFYKNNSK